MKLDDDFYISIRWSVKDVKAIAKSMGLPELSTQEAVQILQKLKNNYNINQGITYYHIRNIIIARNKDSIRIKG